MGQISFLIPIHQMAALHYQRAYLFIVLCYKCRHGKRWRANDRRIAISTWLYLRFTRHHDNDSTETKYREDKETDSRCAVNSRTGYLRPQPVHRPRTCFEDKKRWWSSTTQKQLCWLSFALSQACQLRTANG